MIENYVRNASSFAGDIDFLFTMITLIIGFWLVLTMSILIYFIVRFRHKEGVKAKYIAGEVSSESNWTHYPHYAVIICDVVLIAFNIMIWVDVKQTLPPQDNIVRIIGQQWSWSFVHAGADGKLDTADDVKTVNDLHLKVNETYHFELQSRDVVHNFAVPAFRLRQDAVPGRTITGWFKPTKEGVYDLQCAEICGYGHGIMGAAVVIHSEGSFNNTMAQIGDGTYESHYQKRMGTKTPLPGQLSKIEDSSEFTKQLASTF